MTQHILVVQSGWVFVGNMEATETEVRLTDAYNIRSWGTTRGLGQLALEGATSSTVLDLYGEVTVPKTAVLLSIRCHCPLTKS